MTYKVQTALEDIEADTPQEAFEIFLNKVREITIIVEEDAPDEPLGMKVHEFTILTFDRS